MGAAIVSRISSLLTNLPTAWLLVWLGLAALSVALIVLMRTRWGQSQPLRKCAVLSLLAHALLGCFATTVKIFTETRGGSGSEEFVVSLADFGEGDFATPADTSLESPWEATPSEPAEATSSDTAAEDSPVPPTPEEKEPVPEPAADAAASAMENPVDPPADESTTVSGPIPESSPVPEEFVAEESPPKEKEPTPEVAPTPDPAPAVDTAASQIDATNPSAASATAVDDSPVAPGEFQPPALYSHRRAANRMSLVRDRGGSDETEAAVAAALAWLANNQESDGSWSAVRHGAGQERRILGHDRQGAGREADPATTGLALLALMGAGNTHLDGEYQENVRLGINYLLRVQAADGNLAGSATFFARMYCHGIASLALSECLAMSGDERLKPAVADAVRYTLRAQDRASGGWRYQPGDAGDMSQHGWQVMALRSAELGGVEFPAAARAGATRFLDSVAAGSQQGLARYRPGQAVSRTMTAEALYCRQLLQTPQSGPAADEAVDYLLAELPGQGPANLYYWYYATLVLFQRQGNEWNVWNEALTTTLLGSQRTEGSLRGSWDTNTVWGGYGGRVYTTSMAALSLEVYYRYLPLFQAEMPVN